MAVSIFADIKGAFDNATYQSLEKAVIKNGFDALTIRWIKSVLVNRKITAGAEDESKMITAAKGCP